MAALALPGAESCLSSRAVLRGAAVRHAQPAARRPAAPLRVVAGNDYENGVFTPLVVAVRNVMGVKPFNQFRGKAISLHSQARRGPWPREASRVFLRLRCFLLRGAPQRRRYCVARACRVRVLTTAPRLAPPRRAASAAAALASSLSEDAWKTSL
jgi:hypothetical protein